MLYMQIRPATVTVLNHRSLREAQRTFPTETRTRFIVEKPLTQSQLRRLAKDLRDRVKCEVLG